MAPRTDPEKFPKDTDLNDLLQELADRLRDKVAVAIHIEDRDSHWLVTTDWR